MFRIDESKAKQTIRFVSGWTAGYAVGQILTPLIPEELPPVPKYVAKVGVYCIGVAVGDAVGKNYYVQLDESLRSYKEAVRRLEEEQDGQK